MALVGHAPGPGPRGGHGVLAASGRGGGGGGGRAVRPQQQIRGHLPPAGRGLLPAQLLLHQEEEPQALRPEIRR